MSNRKTRGKSSKGKKSAKKKEMRKCPHCAGKGLIPKKKSRKAPKRKALLEVDEHIYSEIVVGHEEPTRKLYEF